MATMLTVSGIHTPNEGRVIWNTNFTNLNSEVETNTATIGAVGGSIVGTSDTQTLTNKTLVSTFRSGTNTISVSRRDLESTSLFLVTSDSGSVSDIDVTGASQYSLQILGQNGIDTYVSSNVLYIRNSATSIFNETGQVLGVGVASVTAGNVAEFGGNVLVSGMFGVGAGHVAAGSAELHIKDATPELRIETTGTQGYQTFYGDSDIFSWTADFTAGTEYLRLAFNGAEKATFYGTGGLTLTQDVTFSKVAGSHTIVGDLDVQGTLTAGGLVATATDVVITNGPVTISGGWTYIDDGALAHDKLATISGGYILIGGPGNVPTAVDVQGVVDMDQYGVFTLQSNVVSFAKMTRPSDNTILGGSGSGADIQALTPGSGDVTFARSGGTLQFTINSNVIDNANISSSAAIDMSKTAFAVNISGIVLNGNTLELAAGGPPADVLYRDLPVGTIITYAGDVTIASGSVEDEVITGWLHCNGWTLDSQSKYDTLKTVILSAWGGAYKLPDLRGQFLRGVDINRGLDPDYATRSGGGASTKVGSTQTNEIQSHRHDLYKGSVETSGARDQWGYPSLDLSDLTTNTAADAIEYTGGAETRPGNVAVIYLIKY